MTLDFDSRLGILASHLLKLVNSFSRPTNKSGSPIFSDKGYCIDVSLKIGSL
jgi:hypothetical protein